MFLSVDYALKVIWHNKVHFKREIIAKVTEAVKTDFRVRFQDFMTLMDWLIFNRQGFDSMFMRPTHHVFMIRNKRFQWQLQTCFEETIIFVAAALQNHIGK